MSNGETMKTMRNGTKMFRFNQGVGAKYRMIDSRSFALGLITIASMYVLIMIM